MTNIELAVAVPTSAEKAENLCLAWFFYSDIFRRFNLEFLANFLYHLSSIIEKYIVIYVAQIS